MSKSCGFLARNTRADMSAFFRVYQKRIYLVTMLRTEVILLEPVSFPDIKDIGPGLQLSLLIDFISIKRRSAPRLDYSRFSKIAVSRFSDKFTVILVFNNK